MKNIDFEEMKEEDLPEVTALYSHYVRNTTATFHAHEITAEEMRGIVFFAQEKYRTFVIREDGALMGYVILTRHKVREAYDITAEVTVYLKPEAIGRGLGSAALRFIEAFAKEKGFHVLVATICGENELSIGLFARNGYDKCAHYREVAKKFGRLLDCVAYQKIIGE